MRILIRGAGWYGCSIGAALIEHGHTVEVQESGPHVFCGASGNIPARLHTGQHYPRSHATRAACQRHHREFMDRYGFLTRGVPVNLYAIAEHESYVDFAQYVATLRNEIEFITVHDPAEFGLRHVEGAILTGERHILARAAREHFERLLDGHVSLLATPEEGDGTDFDLVIDCTFAANSSAGIDRYEPCLVLLLEGPADRAVTIMDGGFPSLYPWDPVNGLSSLSSALYTPFSKTIRTYSEAQALITDRKGLEIGQRAFEMFAQMRRFYPALEQYKIADHMLSIRAMPKSGADTRLVDVVRVTDKLLRVRAGKIDAVLDAERQVMELIGCR